MEKAYENTNLFVTLLGTEKTLDYVIRTFNVRKVSSAIRDQSVVVYILHVSCCYGDVIFCMRC